MGSQTFIPREHDVFSGLDVDKRSISVTFTDHHGFLKSLRMPHSVEHLLNHVRKHFPNQKVAFAYEAGPTGYGLYDGIVVQGYPCLIAAPSMIPKAPGQRVKTNRLDSRSLSENLRGGAIEEHSCSLSLISRASPFHSAAGCVGERAGGDEAK